MTSLELRREDPRDVARRVLQRAEEGGAFDDLLAPHLAAGPLYWALVRERAETIVGNAYGTRLVFHLETLDRRRRLHFTIDGRNQRIRNGRGSRARRETT